MRKRFDVQLSLSATPIEQIVIKKTRISNTAVFRALQWIFTTPQINEEIFTLLESKLSSQQKHLGRTGMDLWSILTFAVVRLDRGASYDELHYLANHDNLLRSMIGISVWDQDIEFSLTTLKDNVSLLDDETLAQVNQIVMKHGNETLLKKNEKQKLKTDSYVLETNVHFPTDLNLALDSARKSIQDSATFANKHNLSGWRKSEAIYRNIKSTHLRITRIQHGGGKHKQERLHKQVKQYLSELENVYDKTSAWLEQPNVASHRTKKKCFPSSRLTQNGLTKAKNAPMWN